MSRWLSWALRYGYSDLGITSDGVWARLSEVAAAGKRTRRDFGSLVNADALHGLLIESDTECRFEVVEGLIRQVPRCDRIDLRRRLKATGEGAKVATANTAINLAGTRQELPFTIAFSRSADPMVSDADAVYSLQFPDVTSVINSPTAKAVGGGGGGGGAGGGVLPSKLLLQRVLQKDGKSEAVAADRAGPPRPPGDYWIPYRDGGEDWYFYDGPLGQWWSSDLKSEPEPYNDDNDPYNDDNDEDSRWTIRCDEY